MQSTRSSRACLSGCFSPQLSWRHSDTEKRRRRRRKRERKSSQSGTVGFERRRKLIFSPRCLFDTSRVQRWRGEVGEGERRTEGGGFYFFCCHSSGRPQSFLEALIPLQILPTLGPLKTWDGSFSGRESRVAASGSPLSFATYPSGLWLSTAATNYVTDLLLLNRNRLTNRCNVKALKEETTVFSWKKKHLTEELWVRPGPLSGIQTAAEPLWQISQVDGIFCSNKLQNSWRSASVLQWWTTSFSPQRSKTF